MIGVGQVLVRVTAPTRAPTIAQRLRHDRLPIDRLRIVRRRDRDPGMVRGLRTGS